MMSSEWNFVIFNKMSGGIAEMYCPSLLDSVSFKFKCIILTESWLSNYSDLNRIDGYNLLRYYDNLQQKLRNFNNLSFLYKF